MIPEQELAFWDSISVFDKEGLLPYVMLIGSWAEYMYQFYFGSDFEPNIKTRDVDFLYTNLRNPGRAIEISKGLRAKGFIYSEDYLTGVGKYAKESSLEIEFIVRVLGSGNQMYMKIPSIGVKAECLRDVNMLSDYPLIVELKNHTITVPEPEAYILQKLLANPARREDKKAKDIQAIRELMNYVDMERMQAILGKLSKKHRQTISDVCRMNFIKI
jgi:hypothetical protein